MKKVISLIFAMMMLAAIFIVSPTASQNVYADSSSFDIQMSTELTPKYEKVHMTMSRKYDGGTFSHILGKNTNKSGIIYIGKKQLSNETQFVITPLKEGEVDFAMGLYHYNGSSTDMVLSGVLEFHVEVILGEDGRFHIANLNDNFVVSASYSTRQKNTERYRIDKFIKLSVEQDEAQNYIFSRTSDAESGENVRKLASLYALEEYYLVNGRHVHKYNDSGVCSKCGLSICDYTKGIPQCFYNVDAPEQGRLLTIRPINKSNGNVLNIPVQVYLPYGYNANKKYNVIFLVPGSSGTIYCWMQDSMAMYGANGNLGRMSGKRLFDWIIYTGQCSPFIAVSISMQPYQDSYSSAYTRYSNFIVNYWLPMIIDGKGVDQSNKEYTFGGTYAASSKESDIIAAKDHFMIAGLSQGSIFVCNNAVNPTYALSKRFGHKVIMSPYTSATALANSYNKDKNNNDNLYFVSGGKSDKSGGGYPHETVMSYTKNATLKQFPAYIFDSGHKFYTWFRGIATVLETAMK